MNQNKYSELLKYSQDNLNLTEITQKDIWEDFLSGCEEKTFLNSWNWGKFQKMTGNKIWRLGIFNSGELFSAALVVKIKAKRGTFLFVPHGPLFRRGNPKSEILNPKQIQNLSAGRQGFKFQILNILLNELKKIAKEESASFIRIAPIEERNEENIKIFRDLGFGDAPIHMHPEITWELDIIPPENELLAGMRKTTRYLIRQAQKNADIKIEQDNSLEGIEKFNKLYQETKERHHFAPFSLDYLKNQFAAFANDNQIVIFSGKYKNEIAASAIIIFWQNLAFYHHGASSLKYSKIPVSYLLQWEAIKEAKKRGCKIYNFWGISPEGQKNHPWHGLTLFKMGFGGYKKEYVKTQDLILSSRYWLNYIIEWIRKAKRGL